MINVTIPWYNKDVSEAVCKSLLLFYRAFLANFLNSLWTISFLSCRANTSPEFSICPRKNNNIEPQVPRIFFHSPDFKKNMTNFLNFITLQERCCRSWVLHVTLQRESEIVCICAGGFVYFVVNKMSYFSISGPGPLLSFACTHSYYAYKKTKI